MCGICGSFTLSGVSNDLSAEALAKAERDTVDTMTLALAHRGPDAHHVVAEGPVVLGHRRLAVIDPGAQADQPMSNADGTCWLVHNGEAYNYEELRRQLESTGARFRTRSDTEVILQLYRKHGDSSIAMLHGMFAFAVWDKSRRRLLLARDRFGEKPLYYFAGSDRFVFASEIKSLLRHPAVERRLDPAALHDFLSFDYVPGPGTVFSGIRQVPPGHFMSIDRHGIQLHRYWQPTFAQSGEVPSLEDASAQIVERLTGSIRSRRQADVPLGVFLSGGIDSAATVALLRQTTNERILTFSLGFSEPDRDERPFARQVAQIFGTEHREFLYQLDLARDFEAIVAHFDQPFSDPAIFPTWELARLAREHVTVALTGEGGDESFAGYDRYVKSAMAESWSRVPRIVRRGAAAVFDALFAGVAADRLVKRLQQFFAMGEQPPQELFCRWLLHFDQDSKRQVFTQDFWHAAGGRDSADRVRELYRDSAGHYVDRTNVLLDVDVRSYLPDDLLIKLDMTTMRHALEGRCPFLDHELFEFVASLPGRWKLHGWKTKWILRRALRRLLPPAVLSRKKRGFGPPVHLWLRGSLCTMAYDTLTSARTRERGYFRPDAVRSLLDEHAAGTHNHGYQLWNLLIFELWHRVVIDRQPAAEPSSVAI